MANEPAISNLGVILGEFSTPISLDKSPKDWMKANIDDFTKISRSLNVELHHIDGILYPRFFLYISAHLKSCTKETKQLKLFLKEQVKSHPYIDETTSMADHQSVNGWLWGWFNKHKCDHCDTDIFASRIEQLLKFDELYVAARIVLLLRNAEKRRNLLQQNDAKSQALLDLFQGLIGRLDLANGIRMPIVSALVKLSEKAKLHPKSLVLQDVRVNGSYPVAGGAAFDLWKGDTNGHLIAIKMVHYVVDIRAYCKEVVLWRQLASPYVLPFYGVCHKPENPLYMGVVMPWMENGNILQYLKNCPHADKYSLALDVARGIDYLHSFKPSVVHGDLKGANILITPSFTACVADVGLRALFPVPGETYDFETLNTASETSKYYMAPELLVGNENPEDAPRTRNLASDIYSLGCVLHEIFTGNPQFVGFSFPQLLLAHLQNHRPARPPIPEMDDFMWELISQCCNKDPSHRPQASDIIHSLRTRMVHPELDIPLCAWDAEIMDRLRAQSVSSPLKELSLSGDLDDLKESEVSESSSCIYSMASTVSSGVDISSIISIDDNQKRPLTEDDIIIAIIGPIGTGKSTFINIATESKRATVGRDLESCTQDIVAFTFPHPNDSNRNIVFVDTPGFDGSIRSDYDILRELSRWLETTYRRGITLAGILLFHRISEPRIRGTPLRNLKVFEELCGLRNVILTTTMWDEVNNEVGMRHEEQLKTVFWGPMMKYGCRTARFSSTYDSAWEIVNQLDINSRLPAIIQEEMVEQGKNLSETAFHFIAQRWKQLVDPREALNRIRWSSTEKSVLRQELDAALLQQQTVEVRLRSLNAKTLGIRYRDIRRETSIGSRTALNRPKNLRESSAESSVGNGSKLIYSHLFSHTLELMKHYKPNQADSLHANYLEWTAHCDEIEQFINHRAIYVTLRKHLAQIPTKNQNAGNLRSLDEVMKDDRNQIAVRISTMLQIQHFRTVFFKQKGLRAQSLLDLLQELLDNLSLPDTRPHLVMVLVRLSRDSGLFPERLVLRSVQIQSRFPLDGGRYGDVWKGSLDGRAVAVKMMRTCNTQDKDEFEALLKTFTKEAVLWAQLSSPYVLPLFGIYCMSEPAVRVCLVSPWMENGNLTQYLKKNPEANRSSLILDVALGLYYLHSFEPPVIHSDLKGVNILVTTEQRACVADFGLCILIQNSNIQCTMSTSAHYGGSVYWMAPELFEDGSEPNRKTCSSDVYAFGCVCFEIFHGKPPFSELNHSQAVLAIKENRPRPRPTHTSLNDDMWTLIQQCLVTDPEARPNLKQVIQKLECHPDVRDHRTPSPWIVPGSNDPVRQDKARTKLRLSTLFARGSNTKDRLARKS